MSQAHPLAVPRLLISLSQTGIDISVSPCTPHQSNQTPMLLRFVLPLHRLYFSVSEYVRS